MKFRIKGIIVVLCISLFSFSLFGCSNNNLSKEYELETDEITIYSTESGFPSITIDDPEEIKTIISLIDFSEWTEAQDEYQQIPDYLIDLNNGTAFSLYSDGDEALAYGSIGSAVHIDYSTGSFGISDSAGYYNMQDAPDEILEYIQALFEESD